MAAVSAAFGAQAITFDPQVIGTGGDFSFAATATYWAGSISQIVPAPQLATTVPGSVRTATVVSEATARPNWWFAGQNWMTFEATILWNGAPDPNARVKVTSVIEDLDNGHSYVMVSMLVPTGSQWANGLTLNQWTRRLRWTDTIEMAPGSTGTLAKWSSTNHVMKMEHNPVPEPASLFAVAFGLLALSRRKTKTY